MPQEWKVQCQFAHTEQTFGCGLSIIRMKKKGKKYIENDSDCSTNETNVICSELNFLDTTIM